MPRHGRRTSDAVSPVAGNSPSRRPGHRHRLLRVGGHVPKPLSMRAQPAWSDFGRRTREGATQWAEGWSGADIDSARARRRKRHWRGRGGHSRVGVPPRATLTGRPRARPALSLQKRASPGSSAQAARSLAAHLLSRARAAASASDRSSKPISTSQGSTNPPRTEV